MLHLSVTDISFPDSHLQFSLQSSRHFLSTRNSQILHKKKNNQKCSEHGFSGNFVKFKQICSPLSSFFLGSTKCETPFVANKRKAHKTPFSKWMFWKHTTGKINRPQMELNSACGPRTLVQMALPQWILSLCQAKTTTDRQGNNSWKYKTQRSPIHNFHLSFDSV